MTLIMSCIVSVLNLCCYYRILIIQMKRYTYDATEFSSLKVCSNIEVNKSLDLSSYTEQSASYPGVAAITSTPPTPVKVPPQSAIK